MVVKTCNRYCLTSKKVICLSYKGRSGDPKTSTLVQPEYRNCLWLIGKNTESVEVGVEHVGHV